MSLEDEVQRAVRAYEQVAGHHANRTWKMIERHGTVGALSRLMESGDLQKGFKALVAGSQIDETFEAVIVRYASSFSPKVVEAAKWRLQMAVDGKL